MMIAIVILSLLCLAAAQTPGIIIFIEIMFIDLAITTRNSTYMLPPSYRLLLLVRA